jgi:hypothetical protein
VGFHIIGFICSKHLGILYQLQWQVREGGGQTPKPIVASRNSQSSKTTSKMYGVDGNKRVKGRRRYLTNPLT